MTNEKINILLVDDRPENLLALEAIIEREEYNLIKAFSGEEALKYLLKYDFAVILLDVQMPGMDGFSTAKIIKAREKTKNIPIIFITANNLDSEHIFLGYSVGAVDYILKPFDPIILKAKVERFVEIYSLHQLLRSQSQLLEKKNKVIEYMAYHDSLTDLPNRRMFNEQLESILTNAKNSNQSLGLIYLDIDKFSKVNDSLGYLIGDKLLKLIAKKLSDTIGQDNFIARVGGDKFVLLLPNRDREDCLELIEKIFDSTQKPLLIDQYEFYITVCIGLAVFPYDGEDPNSLMKNADAALYRAKEQGQNKFSIYHSGMNIQTYRTFLMQTELRKAVEKQQFTLVYQPRSNIATGQIDTVEAIILWHHPKWGTITQEEFIPLANESDFIFEINNWVIDQVCKQINDWQESYGRSIRVSLNFKAQYFLQRNLMMQLKKTLKDAKVNPNLIQFEIIESSFLRDEESSIKVLQQLKDLGMHVSLINYGTGYTSFNILSRFSFDSVKIAKQFIEKLKNTKNSRVIAESIITLLKKLNIKVVADGIDTNEQMNFFREYQCDEVQGLVISPALTSQQLMDFIIMNKNNTKQILPSQNPTMDNITILKPIEENGLNKDRLKHAIAQIKNEYSLSSRELDVFSLIVEGLSNKEISEKLFISEHTVKNHITNILSKLHVSDRVNAIALVYERCMNHSTIQP